MKELRLSRDHKLISGVMGGFGEYFNIDPVIFRLGYTLLSLATGILPGVVVYIIAAALIPQTPPPPPKPSLPLFEAGNESTEI